jgi:L-lactate utilization protein LutC
MFTAVARAELAPAMVARAKTLGVPSFSCARTPALVAGGVAEHLRRAGIAEIEPPSQPERVREVLGPSRLSVVEADLALSASGTVGLIADTGRGRLASALARILFVLVDPRVLLGRLEDLPGWLGDHGIPSALALFTGPSRTGDIEGSLIIGAHGAVELHVFWLAEGSPLTPGT